MPTPSRLAFAAPTFDCFKNFDRREVDIVVSGTVPAGNFAAFPQVVTIDRESAVTEMQFVTSATSVLHTPGRTYLLLTDTSVDHTDGSTASLPGTAPYLIFFQNEVVNSTLTLSAMVANENAETLTVVNETFNFLIYTYIAPFA